ncbi:MAG: dTMP kinase [Armatimonadota bacterium]
MTIEGGEGAGKSTLAQLMAERLREQGLKVVLTAEPGGDPVCLQIRKLLLDSSIVISERAELLLFEAARAQHVERVIKPAVEEGAVVICDRFVDSTVAYQGYGRGIERGLVEILNEIATQGLKPHLTLLLDLPPEKGLERNHVSDRFAKEGIQFHNAVREGYLAIASREPQRFVIIDAEQPVENVLRAALDAVGSRWRELVGLDGSEV